jgi:quercetin dioxygenase-like cupin family protein
VPVPSLGYVLKGALFIRYKGGQQEVARAGDFWYAPAGHTAWVEEDTEFIDFSPEDQLGEVLDHIKKQMGG